MLDDPTVSKVLIARTDRLALKSSIDFTAAGAIEHPIETYHWQASPLGPREHWPNRLSAAMDILLPAQAKIALFWGEEFVTLYDEAYAPTIGEHPRAFGRPARENWGELWSDLSYSPVRDEERRVRGVLCVVKETTDRVMFESALQVSPERLRAIFS